MRPAWVVLFIVAFALVLDSTFFAIQETEYGIVTRFGDPRWVITEPGLRAKWPYPIESLVRLDKRLLCSDIPRPDEPPKEFLTKDKKNIEVAVYVSWRIRDPKVFLERIGTSREDAEARLGDIIVSELGKTLGCFELADLLSTEPGRIKLPEMTEQIRTTCGELVASEDKYDYGVEIVDFRIKRINFPQQNRDSVFQRMRAERKRIATQYRSEGDKEATIIRAEAEKQKREILADAYRQAREIEGRAEAEATRIYAEAYQQDVEFYEFSRTLESYEKSLGAGTTLFLPADSPYLRWLKAPPTTTAPAEADGRASSGTPATNKAAATDDAPVKTITWVTDNAPAVSRPVEANTPTGTEAPATTGGAVADGASAEPHELAGTNTVASTDE